VFAAWTAASTSSALANGTRRMTCPVAALVTSPARVLFDAAGCPPIHSGTVGTVVVTIISPIVGQSIGWPAASQERRRPVRNARGRPAPRIGPAVRAFRARERCFPRAGTERLDPHGCE